jgi:hypothetical protein
METTAYWRQYDLLRRHALSWDIDYARYTHEQLRYAIELNKGIVDASLRAKLFGMPPLNAYYAAMRSAKAQTHEPPGRIANQQTSPLPDSPPSSSAPEKRMPMATPSFALPAPKEASPWI